VIAVPVRDDRRLDRENRVDVQTDVGEEQAAGVDSTRTLRRG
jgi:hypothetical protein